MGTTTVAPNASTIGEVVASTSNRSSTSGSHNTSAAAIAALGGKHDKASEFELSTAAPSSGTRTLSPHRATTPKKLPLPGLGIVAVSALAATSLLFCKPRMVNRDTRDVLLPPGEHGEDAV